MSTPDQLAAKLRLAGQRLQDAQRVAMANAMKTAKAALIAARDEATGGDGVLSHVGKKGAKLGVNYKIEDGGTSLQGYIRATGAWPIIESDTPAHEETSKLPRIKGKGGARAGKERDLRVAFRARGAFSGVKPMGRLGGFGPVYRARHPGTHGKHVFVRARAATAAKLPAQIAKDVWTPVLQVFRS